MKGRKPRLKVVPSTGGAPKGQWTCPDWLPAGSAPVWRSAVQDLADRGLLCEAARPLLEAYVLSYAQIRQLQAQLAAARIADDERVHPAFTALQRAIQSARLLATELTLTIARRGAGTSVEVDEFAGVDI
jgi:phage terminase small subunit